MSLSTVDRENLQKLYPALQGLAPERLAQILVESRLLRLPAGTEVFAERQACQGFPLLLEGSIKVVKQAGNGRESNETSEHESILPRGARYVWRRRQVF